MLLKALPRNKFEDSQTYGKWGKRQCYLKQSQGTSSKTRRFMGSGTRGNVTKSTPKKQVRRLEDLWEVGQEAMLLKALPRNKFEDSQTRGKWGIAFVGDHFEGSMI